MQGLPLILYTTVRLDIFHDFGRTLPPGVEYEVQDAQEPHLFIIRKQHRSGPKTTAPLQYYYILDGSVYQAPSLHAALSSRIVRIRLTRHSSFLSMQAMICIV